MRNKENMFNLILFLFSGILWKKGDCFIRWEVTHHKDYSNGYTWEEADTICKKDGKVLAVVDSQEKWEKLKYVITGGNRYTAPADVYIGLQFTESINNFTWSNGVQASWTKWYDNEPYFTDTRHCVRLDIYTDYSFRTSDCSNRHHFACSYEAMDMDPAMRLSTCMKAPTGEINHIADIMNISTNHVLECSRECMTRENCTFFVYSKQEQKCGLYKDDKEHGNVIECSQDMFCYFVWV